MAKIKSNSEEVLSQFIKAEKARFPISMSDSRFFEIFAAQQVLKANDLSDKEIENGIVGEGLDGGIDGLYFFINGQLIQDEIKSYDPWKKNIDLEVFVIQSKTTAGFGEDAIHKLVNTTEDIFTINNVLSAKKFKERYNPELLEIAERFNIGYKSLVVKGITLRFHYFYVTQGDNVHPNTKGLTEKLGKKIQELFFNKASFDFTFLGARDLVEIASRRPAQKIEIELSKQVLYSDKNSCVCLVKLKDFYKFIVDKATNKINRHIFEANVRDYQGDSGVNKEIRETLQTTEGDNFWWLNNGITILTNEITAKGNSSLILDSPEIVNGLQTSNEIYNYFSSITPEEVEKESREVLLRIINPEHDKSRDKIIKATNSQTRIPTTALKATDPVHRDIEQYLYSKGLFYDRRKNFYKNEGKPQTQIVTIIELAQAMIAIKLRHPDDARARPSNIFANDDEYAKIFSYKIPLQLYYAVLLIMQKVTSFFTSASLSNNEQTNLRYYVAYYATCLASSKVYLTDNDILIASEALTPTILVQALERVKLAYQKAGGNDKAAKGLAFRESLENELLLMLMPEVAKNRAAVKQRSTLSKATPLKKKAAAMKKVTKKIAVPKKTIEVKSAGKKATPPKKKAAATRERTAEKISAPKKKIRVKGVEKQAPLPKKKAATKEKSPKGK
ncbi:AIPR family protein [Chitinophaga tropicalis]|uniref:Abortive phage resistance protein n=1 Tax=Chitinophaga tropicalis TaxID=2683588 RepID=A0A7K1U1W2_9BACT|nr:AIPR family protein [Chitinophaga tropicalis]MVT08333.1 abortive phage resistance protein [Chitinophaga tropicalis]